MSKSDTTPGLLSKMVKFVRNPATNWSDLDAGQSDREDALSKQLLKEMIERKRRNDFVRQREFDMLRKLRKREAMAGVGQELSGARASFFQSSLPSAPDDRAQTLKKIDEIEAQMSMQWWKTKTARASQQPAAASEKSTSQAYAPTDEFMPKAYAATVPAQYSETGTFQALAPKEQAEASGQLLSLAVGAGSSAAAADSKVSKPTSFSHSKISVVAVKDFVHDPELEEVAIRFANGDDGGAELGLAEILAPQGGRASHIETWLTLFDFYRANGWQDKFESAAIDFAGRFSRSAPQWFSMPDMVKLLRQPALTGAGIAAHWICPSAIGVQTVVALKAALTKAPMPWRLDWHNLKSVDIGAVDQLHQLFELWSQQPIEISFIGDEQLRSALRSRTVSGERTVPQQWWLLRLAMLRVTGRADDFELTALDFCVTYELSPPSWAAPRCKYTAINPQGDKEISATIIGEVFRDSGMSSVVSFENDTVIGGPQSVLNSITAVELSGQIQGDVNDVLDKLLAKFADADRIVVSCAKLIRVDFSAAGALLNWVSAREAERRSVQFADVNRLVAAFFSVIGITEHATIIVRND